MAGQYLVRVGPMGRLGHYRSSGREAYPRLARVLVRSSRGLQVGQVLVPVHGAEPWPCEGTLLRRLTVEDELLLVRLEQRRHEAFVACVRRLQQLGTRATLLDVELLFDGSALCFYFLGEPPSELEEHLAELAAAYDAQAQIERFAQTLLAGCGPHCGTESAGGCGEACSACAVAAACASGAKKTA